MTSRRPAAPGFSGTTKPTSVGCAAGCASFGSRQSRPVRDGASSTFPPVGRLGGGAALVRASRQASGVALHGPAVRGSSRRDRQGRAERVLNGTMTMPSNVASTLSQHGITAQDYMQILNADPFANNPNGQGKPDPARFAQLTVLPYEPISGQYTWKTGNNYTSSTTNASNVSYSVGATVSTSVIQQSLKISDKFTWGNSSSQKNTVGSSQTETFVLAMPSSTYSGPTDLYVYVDTIYKTFLFSFFDPSGAMTSRYSVQANRR